MKAWNTCWSPLKNSKRELAVLSLSIKTITAVKLLSTHLAHARSSIQHNSLIGLIDHLTKEIGQRFRSIEVIYDKNTFTHSPLIPFQ